jgi:hypothetical protein
VYHFHIEKTFNKPAFSEEAWHLLAALADADSIARTPMLEIAIREAARKRGLHAGPRIQAQSESDSTERH